MTEINILVFGRVLERVLITLFAGGSMFLGWHLFAAGIDKMQKAELTHKAWSVKLERVGPGIFFALFGATLLALGLITPLSTMRHDSSGPVADQSGSSAGQIEFRYVEDQQAMALSLSQSINTIERHFERLEDEDRERKRLERPLSVLQSFRNELVADRFGRAALETYTANETLFMRDPSALSRTDRELADELSEWLVESLPGRAE